MTVNRVPARGGSMGAPGPTVAGGLLFVGSGYVGLGNGTPGNVLLAFGRRDNSRLPLQLPSVWESGSWLVDC